MSTPPDPSIPRPADRQPENLVASGDVSAMDGGEQAQLAAQVRDVMVELRRCFSERDGEGLVRILDLPYVWLVDRPVEVAEFIAWFEGNVAGEEELDFDFTSIVAGNVGEGRAHLSVTAVLGTRSEVGVTVREQRGVIHLGFRRDGDRWRVAYLGVTGRERRDGGERERTADLGRLRQLLVPQGVPARPGHVVIQVPVQVPADALAEFLAGGKQ